MPASRRSVPPPTVVHPPRVQPGAAFIQQIQDERSATNFHAQAELRAGAWQWKLVAAREGQVDVLRAERRNDVPTAQNAMVGGVQPDIQGWLLGCDGFADATDSARP